MLSPTLFSRLQKIAYAIHSPVQKLGITCEMLYFSLYHIIFLGTTNHLPWLSLPLFVVLFYYYSAKARRLVSKIFRISIPCYTNIVQAVQFIISSPWTTNLCAALQDLFKGDNPSKYCSILSERLVSTGTVLLNEVSLFTTHMRWTLSTAWDSQMAWKARQDADSDLSAVGLQFSWYVFRKWQITLGTITA
jgi:hypothetical protein